MPMTPTLLNAKQNSTSSTSITSDSISPTADGLLVVHAVIGKTGTPAPTSFSVSDTFSGTGAWTIHKQISENSNNSQTEIIATAKAGSSPGSGTITVSWTNAGIRNLAQFCEVPSGFDTAAPVTQAAHNTGTSNSITVTFGATPAADSLVIACLASRSGGSVGSDGAMTRLSGPLNESPFTATVDYDNASAAISHTWTPIGTTSNIAMAIEIKAAAAGGTSLPYAPNPLHAMIGR